MTLGVLTVVKTTVLLFCVLTLWVCRSMPSIGRNIMSMHRAEVHWRWRQRICLKRLYLPTSSHGVKYHKENYRCDHFNPTHSLHLNSTSVRSILIVASYQSMGQSSDLSFSSPRTKILCAFVVSRLHTNRPTHMTVRDFIIPIYNVWWRVQIVKLLIIPHSPASCQFFTIRHALTMKNVIEILLAFSGVNKLKMSA
jgi:hypothetical protein